MLARAYEQDHARSEAIAEEEMAVRLSDGSPLYVAALGYAYALSGDRTKALATLGELEAMSKRRYVSPLEIAIVYTGLGEKDAALDWLERAYQERTFRLTTLPDANFDPLRSDPRFQDLVRRIGLPPFDDKSAKRH